MDIEKLKRLAALPGDIAYDNLAYWMADHAEEIIRELEEGCLHMSRKDTTIGIISNALSHTERELSMWHCKAGEFENESRRLKLDLEEARNDALMRWISVDVALPEDGQAVLVRYAKDNWHCTHKVANGYSRRLWRWQAARFIRGKTLDEAKSAKIYRNEDEYGNNQRPYCWKEFGPMTIFGQDVTHWAAISDPCDE